MGSVKKKKLFERSEFFFFSFTLPYFSKIRAALTFCFFCVKAKEKVFQSRQKKKHSSNNNPKKMESIIQKDTLPFLSFKAIKPFYTFGKKRKLWHLIKPNS